jgi:hypothetical protein
VDAGDGGRGSQRLLQQLALLDQQAHVRSGVLHTFGGHGAGHRPDRRGGERVGGQDAADDADQVRVGDGDAAALAGEAVLVGQGIRNRYSRGSTSRKGQTLPLTSMTSPKYSPIQTAPGIGLTG